MWSRLHSENLYQRRKMGEGRKEERKGEREEGREGGREGRREGGREEGREGEKVGQDRRRHSWSISDSTQFLNTHTR